MLPKFLFTLLFLAGSCLLPFIAAAEEVKMADELRSNGKIYVVVIVLATIFAGIIIYLIRLDRKISRLENHSNK